MKMIQNKKFIQKILILLLIVVSFNFICPSIANAGDDDTLGGVLIGSVADLLTALGDGILNIIHRFVIDQEDTLIHLTGSGWQIFGNIMIAIAAAILAGLLIWWTAGAITPLLTAIGATVTGLSIAGTVIVGGAAIGYVTYSSLPKDELYLPVYSISPEEIFYGKVPLLNVNFFNPEARKNIYDEYSTEHSEPSEPIGEILSENGCKLIPYYETTTKFEDGYRYTDYEWKYNGDIYRISGKYTPSMKNVVNYVRFYKNDVLIDSIEKIHTFTGTSLKDHWKCEEIMNDDTYGCKTVQQLLTSDNPDDFEIFTVENGTYIARWEDEEGNLYTLKITNGTKKLTVNKSYINIASELQPIVAKWYVTLRNVALVISMSILVYIGIRMMLTSIASEKAKYKNMLFDWLIGVGLIFVMQYIMVFTTYLNDQFINFISSTSETLYTVEFPKNEDLKWGDAPKDFYEELDVNGETWIVYPTNLMGQVRIGIQDMRDESLMYAGYVIVFLVLVFYTVFFIFTYLKRVIYMAFLTIISPFVAMTYSIDKLTDGKAQAFNMWLKEYIFNLLIQPMHLLLYYILVVSAIELANKNVLYSLVAIGFLIPAEKLIRKFFGFDKAQTPGFLGGTAGAALVMSAVGNLRRFSSSGKGGGHKDDSSNNDGGKIRTKDKGIKKEEELSVDNVFGGSGSNGSGDNANIRIANKPEVQEGENPTTEKGSKPGTQDDKNSDKGNTVANNSKTTNSKDGGTGPSLGKRILGAAKGAGMGVLSSGVRLTGKIPGLAARGFGAATLGAVGLAAGIATGDASNALQYTLTGAGAGSALGAGLSNRASNAFGNIADDGIRGWYGDDYDSYLNKQSDRQFMASKENRDFYKQMFGDDWKTRMEEARDHYRKYGITDNKIIAKAMKLKGYDQKAQVYIANLASQISSRSEWARARESFEQRGVSASVIKKIEDGVFSIKKWKT